MPGPASWGLPAPAAAPGRAALSPGTDDCRLGNSRARPTQYVIFMNK